MKMVKTEIKVSDYMDDQFGRGTLEFSISPVHAGDCVLNIQHKGFTVTEMWKCNCEIGLNHLICEDCPTESSETVEDSVYNYMGLRFRTQREAINALKQVVKDLEEQL